MWREKVVWSSALLNKNRKDTPPIQITMQILSIEVGGTQFNAEKLRNTNGKKFCRGVISLNEKKNEIKNK